MNENNKRTCSNKCVGPLHVGPQTPDRETTLQLFLTGRLEPKVQRLELAFWKWVPSTLPQVQHRETRVFACFGHGFSPFSPQNRLVRFPIRPKWSKAWPKASTHRIRPFLDTWTTYQINENGFLKTSSL